MSGREIILINSMPGSGAGKLGEILASTEHSSEAIDFSRLVHHIGETSITSLYENDIKAHLNSRRTPEELPPELGTNIIRESIQKADFSRRLVISGFPYDKSQVPALHEIADRTGRSITDALYVVTHEDLAAQALIDGEYPVSEEEARAMLSRHRIESHLVRMALFESDIFVHRKLYVESGGDTPHYELSLDMAQHQLAGAEYYENNLVA